MVDLLVDTDVFVDHLRGYRPLTTDGDRVHYSVITRAELFAGKQGQDELIRLLLGAFVEIGIDQVIAEQGGRLRRDLSIALPDALIAATALRNELTLVTRDVKDFASVPGLSVRTPA